MRKLNNRILPKLSPEINLTITVMKYRHSLFSVESTWILLIYDLLYTLKFFLANERCFISETNALL